MSTSSLHKIPGPDNYENDDLITFQHESKTINFYFSQLIKYSKRLRESYLFSDAINRLPQEIHKLEEEYHLLPDTMNYFFYLLQQKYDINDETNLTYSQCIDLLRISKFFEIRKLSSKIKEYIESHHIDIDFIIQMILYENNTQTGEDKYQIKVSEEMENFLTNKINDCLTNEKFKELPIQIIHRIINQSPPNVINNDNLFDIIISSMNKFCILFPFLDLQKLSEDRLDKLCEMHLKSKENTQHQFDYLKCNLKLIKEINNCKKNLQIKNDQQQDQMNNLKTKITSLQDQLNKSESSNKDKEKQMKDYKTKITSLQDQLNKSENSNKDKENQMKDLINQINQLQNKLKNSEKQLKEIFLIEGQIVASVENGIIINAEIKLKTNGQTLDSTKSKIIISTSDVKLLGSEAYEKGESITSNHMKTSFVCRTGTYYVRCIIFNSNGKSNEIVSNAVKTSGIFTFSYEGKASKISLPRGSYKLEVWGAKGGDSTGNGRSSGNRQGNSTVEGGYGGYSRGIVSFDKNETVYVYVGGEGCPSNSSEGSSTEGGFPDGGGTRTGHFPGYTTVPGTGGGSTSIRIGKDSDYNRVIVAGGGGGASGCSYYREPGGFGGGLNGGNCSYLESHQSQGAGTQTGSTGGIGNGDDRHGDPGRFGSGATVNYKQGCDSGGGGGGNGDYNCCSSGGGGSGWTFTDSSMRMWESGDKSNALKFKLNERYYLTESVCIGGNEEFPRPDGNGTERGHRGNGYAKITLL